MAKYFLSLILAVATLFATTVNGQFQNWPASQANTTICSWNGLRAAIIRDTIYLEGGEIYWMAGRKDGTYAQPSFSPNPSGYMLTYNLSRPFDANTNVTEILVRDKISRVTGRNPSGVAGSAGITFYDGGILANNDQFFLFGGKPISLGSAIPLPGDRAVSDFIAWQEQPDGSHSLSESFIEKFLPQGMTRYVAFGGSVSAPSENKAWYFSGLRSATHGPILQATQNEANDTTAISDTLITVDMSNPVKPVWNNITEGNPQGRAGSQVVWVPVGEQGILVALGGEVYSEKSSKSMADKKKTSEGFMQDIDVYDVATKKWYKQGTSNGPGVRTRGCAVVASPSDHSSFHIYYYGGFDGTNFDDPFYDEVWVLSLPSFTWTLLNKGNPEHGRARHQCFTPYPDQMMAIGGVPTGLKLKDNTCLEPHPVVVFNMTSGEWLNSYDPTAYGNYSVPDKVRATIGSNTAKPAGGWDSSGLDKVFGQPYDHSKIETFYPYQLEASPTSRPELKPEDNRDSGKSGVAPWLAPVLGVVLGLVLVTAVIVGFCFWRRRKILKSRKSESGTEDPGMRIMSWVRGQQSQPLEVKAAPTVTTTEEMPANPEFRQSPPVAVSPPAQTVYSGYSGYSPYEMGDTQVVMELDDTSPPAELYNNNTGLTHFTASTRQLDNGTPTRARSLSKPSSNAGDVDFSDSVSQASGPVAGLVDSPTLANSPGGSTEHNTRCTSDVSMVTNRASHLRNLSDATVSSEGTQVEPRAALERTGPPGVQPIPEGNESRENIESGVPRMESGALPEFEVPVSPPTADEVNAQDYLDARPLVSPIVKPAYPEDEESAGRK